MHEQIVRLQTMTHLTSGTKSTHAKIGIDNEDYCNMMPKLIIAPTTKMDE